MSGISFDGELSIEHIMNKLLDMGCNTVIITLGKQGAIYASQKDRTVKKVFTAIVQPIDTTV